MAAAGASRHHRGVGLNPFRPAKRRASDYVMVAAAVVVCVLAVLWAMFGG